MESYKGHTIEEHLDDIYENTRRLSVLNFNIQIQLDEIVGGYSKMGAVVSALKTRIEELERRVSLLAITGL